MELRRNPGCRGLHHIYELMSQIGVLVICLRRVQVVVRIEDGGSHHVPMVRVVIVVGSHGGVNGIVDTTVLC